MTFSHIVRTKIDLLYTRPVILLNIVGISHDLINYNHFGFLLVKGDINRTRRAYITESSQKSQL